MARAAAAYVLGAVAGYAADARFGDPRRGHPVAGFGRAAGRLEQALWRDHRGPGRCTPPPVWARWRPARWPSTGWPGAGGC